MANGGTTPGRMRIWPAIVPPLGLTFLLGAAVWLFFSKVAADRETADALALRLESRARLEAGELAGRARDIAEAFVDARMKGRADQEKNIRVELRGVMEAVSRVLTDGLEKTRAAAAAPRDGVGNFPAGFESLRLYLELAGDAAGDGDAAVRAMRACLPELSALMPSGCSLAVVENNAQEILSVGGGAAPENARTEAMSRELLWGDGAAGRRWTLHLRLSEADAYPEPDAAETAAHLSERLADVRLDGPARMTWAGWLVDDSGRAAASFPVHPGGEGGDSADAPPFLGTPGEWMEIDGRRLVWQERAGRLTGAALVPAVALAIDRPAPPLVWTEELSRDTRWSLTLGILGVLALATWVWFSRSFLVSRTRSPARQSRPDAHAAARAAAETALAAARNGVGKTAAAPERRLVRDGSDSRPFAGAPGVIVADITDDGEVVVEAELQPPRPRPRLVIPSGSLLRLQERHRGGKGRQGCRVLDQARSQLLRELAGRVRPVVGGAFSGAEDRRPRTSGRATERIARPKS